MGYNLLYVAFLLAMIAWIRGSSFHKLLGTPPEMEAMLWQLSVTM
jgi:hypothetical protein